MHPDRIAKIVRHLTEQAPAFGDTSDDWIADPERMQRCWDAAADGAEGSTHAEILDDQRHACLDALWHPTHERDRLKNAVNRYFDDLEDWHATNGTLDQQVG